MHFICGNILGETTSHKHAHIHTHTDIYHLKLDMLATSYFIFSYSHGQFKITTMAATTTIHRGIHFKIPLHSQ